MYAQDMPEDNRLESVPSINAGIHDKIVLTRVLCGDPHIKPQVTPSMYIKSAFRFQVTSFTPNSILKSAPAP